jgi:beta-lactamase class D
LNPGHIWLKTGVAAVALSLFTTAYCNELPRPVETYFEAYRGCALILTRDRHDESALEFGPKQCALPLSPCSTFKIPNALIGLQQGVINGPGHIKTWDGTRHEREANNRDHSLASAIEHSVVWYFQSLARDVGAEAMQQWLDRLDYGNRDTSAGIDRFWLGSSLRISAHGQLELLKALKHQTLPFRPGIQQQVQDMLVQDSGLAGTLHAKTGSCLGATDADPDHGWFIGWIDWSKNAARNPATTWFVVNITGHKAWGREARQIALQLLHDLQP